MRKAFTLIELLVVVAIISILSMIALPNFLEAQTRSKVAAAKNNMRVMATRIEMYHVDWNTYPKAFSHLLAGVGDGTIGIISSPGGVTHHILGELFLDRKTWGRSEPLDPFSVPLYCGDEKQKLSVMGGLVYFNHRWFASMANDGVSQWDNRDPENWRVSNELAGEWSLHSIGPARIDYYIDTIKCRDFHCWIIGVPITANPELERAIFREYDPTNGTVSRGQIYRTQRNPGGLGFHPQFYRTEH